MYAAGFPGQFPGVDDTPLRNGATALPRGGDARWLVGPAGALLQREFFGLDFDPVYIGADGPTLRYLGTRSVQGVRYLGPRTLY